MEGSNWAVITRLMKHRHVCWTLRGGEHLAKKGSGRLDDVISKLKEAMFRSEYAEAAEETILSAAKVGEMCGKVYEYGKRG